MDEFAAALAQLSRRRALARGRADGRRTQIVHRRRRHQRDGRHRKRRAGEDIHHAACTAAATRSAASRFRSSPASRAIASAPASKSRRRATFASRPRQLHSACPKSSSAFPRSSRRRCCRSWSAGDGRARSCCSARRSRAGEALAWRLVEHVVPAAASIGAVETWIGQSLDLGAARRAAAKAADPAVGRPAAFAPPSPPASTPSPLLTRPTSPPSPCVNFSPRKSAQMRAAVSVQTSFRAIAGGCRAPGTRRNARAKNSPRSSPGRRRPWPATLATSKISAATRSVAVLASHPATPETTNAK